MAGRSASTARGQAVKPGKEKKRSIPPTRAVVAPGKAKKSWGGGKTIATRLPKKWGGR